MSFVLAAILWLAYLSLLAELVLLHVPSVASSYQLLTAPAGMAMGNSARWQRLAALSMPLKSALLVLPLIAIYAVFAFPLAVTVVGPDPLGDYVFSPMTATQAGGVALIVTGRIFSLAATLTIRVDNAQHEDSYFLHSTGVFSWTRNPGLIGMFVFVIGAWLLTPSLAMAIGIGFYIAYMRFKVGLEEDFLRDKFGAAYDEYCDRTPRFLL